MESSLPVHTHTHSHHNIVQMEGIDELILKDDRAD